MSDADDLHQGVLNAIEAHDFHAAIDILEALATVDLERAAALHGTIKDALTVATFLRLAGDGSR